MMEVLENKVRGWNLTNEFLVPRIKAEELGGEKDLGLLADEQCSAFVGAICYKSSFLRLWRMHCGLSTPIPQPSAEKIFSAFIEAEISVKHQL